MNNNERWLLLGDIHGDPSPLESFYEENKRRLNLDKHQTYILLLGDVGINMLMEPRDSYIKDRMSRLPFTYICLRGNHEARVENAIKLHPERWIKVKLYGGDVFVEMQYPNIHYLEDKVAVYKFAGFKTLAIAGAYSIDKGYRQMTGKPWFEDEQLTKQERDDGKKLAVREGPFDLIISHTAPFAFEPSEFFPPGVEQECVEKTMEHFLGEVEVDIGYKRWAFGHYHGNKLYPWNGEKEMMCLYNQRLVDLERFMNMSKTDWWDDIIV